MHQRQRTPLAPANPRRTLGESTLAGLLLFWTWLLCYLHGRFLLSLFDPYYVYPRWIGVYGLLLALEIGASLFSGLCVLLRNIRSARVGLLIAGTCWFGITALSFLRGFNPRNLYDLMTSVGFLLVAFLLFFLSWWVEKMR
jgi:hypothetical protein